MYSCHSSGKRTDLGLDNSLYLLCRMFYIRTIDYPFKITDVTLIPLKSAAYTGVSTLGRGLNLHCDEFVF